jgi:hypothetical protein
MKKFISQIFQDERGNFSSNRFVGIICTITLCYTLLHIQYTKSNVSVPDMLVESIAALAFGALGLGAANKIFKKPDIVIDSSGDKQIEE